MLGSAALLLPCSRRFGLNVAAGGGEAGASLAGTTNAAAESAHANATVRLPTYLFIAFPRCELTGLSERVSRSLVFKPVDRDPHVTERNARVNSRPLRRPAPLLSANSNLGTRFRSASAQA